MEKVYKERVQGECTKGKGTVRVRGITRERGDIQGHGGGDMERGQ